MAVKSKYDPQGYFSFPQMVAPYPNGGGGAAASVTWPPEVARALAQPIVYADGSKGSR